MEKSIEKTVFNLFIIATSITFVLCIVFAPQIAAYNNPTTKIPPESLAICVSPANIRLSNGYYNVSVPIVNDGATDAQLQKFYIHPYENTLPLNRTIPAMALYFNGTSVNPSQFDITVKTGDNIEASFLLPCAEYAANTNMSLTVYTSQAMYWREFALNWLP
jgi:hypothetical protein